MYYYVQIGEWLALAEIRGGHYQPDPVWEYAARFPTLEGAGRALAVFFASEWSAGYDPVNARIVVVED